MLVFLQIPIFTLKSVCRRQFALLNSLIIVQKQMSLEAYVHVHGAYVRVMFIQNVWIEIG